MDNLILITKLDKLGGRSQINESDFDIVVFVKIKDNIGRMDVIMNVSCSMYALQTFNKLFGDDKN